MDHLPMCLIKKMSAALLSLCLTSAGSFLFADIAQNPMIAVDSLGSQYAVWEVRTDNSSYIQAATNIGSGWGPSVTISGSQIPANQPKVFTNQSGNTIAAWTFIDEVNHVNSLAVSTFSIGSGWSVPTVVSSSNENVSGNFNLTINESGEIKIIWNSYLMNSGSHVIMISEGAAEGVWSKPTQLF